MRRVKIGAILYYHACLEPITGGESIMPARSTRLWVALAAAVLAAASFGQAARAACLLGMVDTPPRLIHAAYRLAAAVPAGHVRIEYLGHSSFLVETPAGVTVVTDYNGVNAPPAPPVMVTMNNSHNTHFTDFPDPAIRYVLRGWKPGGGMARHDITVKDMRIFNIATNIGEYGDPGSNGNSVFVIEVSGLCIAHTGHLHHVLTRDQLTRLGRIDVLFVPVDGGMTMSHAEALENIRLISPRLVIPMHFGFAGSPDVFFELARKDYRIDYREGSVLMVKRSMLPRRTEILFLQGQ